MIQLNLFSALELVLGILFLAASLSCQLQAIEMVSSQIGGRFVAFVGQKGLIVLIYREIVGQK